MMHPDTVSYQKVIEGAVQTTKERPDILSVCLVG